jgi:hypothetical protein
VHCLLNESPSIENRVSIYNCPIPYLDVFKDFGILLSEMYPMIYERKKKEK